MTPNHYVWRPRDTVETAVAWKMALKTKTAPSSLILSRQNLAFQSRSDEQIQNIEKADIF